MQGRLYRWATLAIFVFHLLAWALYCSVVCFFLRLFQNAQRILVATNSKHGTQPPRPACYSIDVKGCNPNVYGVPLGGEGGEYRWF